MEEGVKWSIRMLWLTKPQAGDMAKNQVIVFHAGQQLDIKV
jgi:hypothetical protein